MANLWTILSDIDLGQACMDRSDSKTLNSKPINKINVHCSCLSQISQNKNYYNLFLGGLIKCDNEDFWPI